MSRGPRVSAEMLRALELIKKGASPAEAARQTGVAPSSISKSRLYRATDRKPRSSAGMLGALEMIKKGASPAEAAREMKIAQSTISRSKLYREYLAEQKKLRESK